MTKKEVADKLIRYLMEQDPEAVATLCSHILIDLNSFMCLKQLSTEEIDSLLHRTSLNVNEMYKVIEGEDYDMELTFNQGDFNKKRQQRH